MSRYEPVITCDPKRQFGRPCINGSRITADTIAEMHWAGDSIPSLVDDYGIHRLDVLWCCAWWVHNGYLGDRRSKRRMRWHLWSEHALLVLGGHLKGPLCDPDDFPSPAAPQEGRETDG